MNRIATAFLLIVLTQGLHSIEEYIGRLWENFPPASFLCSLISDDLHLGFLVINIGIFVLGLLLLVFVVQPNRAMTKTVIWIWIIVELINGIGHPVWSILQKSYTPGLITAPILLILALYTIRLTRQNK